MCWVEKPCIIQYLQNKIQWLFLNEVQITKTNSGCFTLEYQTLSKWCISQHFCIYKHMILAFLWAKLQLFIQCSAHFYMNKWFHRHCFMPNAKLKGTFCIHFCHHNLWHLTALVILNIFILWIYISRCNWNVISRFLNILSEIKVYSLNYYFHNLQSHIQT